MARHWHECYRLSHPLPPDHPKSRARVPWEELDPFLRQDNILQLRSLLLAVVTRGRQWALAHLVPDGSVIELSESDIDGDRGRRAHPMAAAAAGGRRERGVVVSWETLAPGVRSDLREHLRSQLAQLDDLGFVPIVLMAVRRKRPISNGWARFRQANSRAASVDHHGGRADARLCRRLAGH